MPKSTNSNKKYDRVIRIKKHSQLELSPLLRNQFNSIKMAYPKLVTDYMDFQAFVEKIFPSNIAQNVIIKNASFLSKKGHRIRCAEIYNENSLFLKSILPNNIFIKFIGKLTNGEFEIIALDLIENPKKDTDIIEAGLMFMYDGPNHSNWLYSITEEIVYNTNQLPWGIFSNINNAPVQALKESKMDYSHNIEKIEFQDFVTIGKIDTCSSHGHTVEEIDATVSILRRFGNIVTKLIPAYYCKNCNKYFISKWQFEGLKDEGVLLCQLIKEHINVSSGWNDNYSDLKAESLLHQSGYNVSAKSNLSSEQRHAILVLLIEHEICSKKGLIHI